MYIVIHLLVSTLTAPSPAPTDIIDLCDVVDATTGTPTICRPHQEGAPVFDADVCCKERDCVPAPAEGCRELEKLHYCWLGEVTQTGQFTCYFEVPNYCDLFPCTSMISPPPLEAPMCCNEGVCWPYLELPNTCEPQDIYYCKDGVSNDDGTITCFQLA